MRTDIPCSCQTAQALVLPLAICGNNHRGPAWHHGQQLGKGEKARGLGKAQVSRCTFYWADCFWRDSWGNTKAFLLHSPFKCLFIYCTKYLHYHCNCLALLRGLTSLQQGLVSAEVLQRSQCSLGCSLGIWSPSKTVKGQVVSWCPLPATNTGPRGHN